MAKRLKVLIVASRRGGGVMKIVGTGSQIPVFGLRRSIVSLPAGSSPPSKSSAGVRGMLSTTGFV